MSSHTPSPSSLAAGLVMDSAACYQVLQARDARFDGHFFTGVRPTDVYCRPVCKVRVPLEKNYTFFALPAQADAAGFCPCLRCRPELVPAASGFYRWSMQDAGAALVRQAFQLLNISKALTA